MIYKGNRDFNGKLVGKFTVEGVDVYPDHESDTQWWYVPGTIKLAERNGKKVLSYLWYTEGSTDPDGTGFFNFEVNTAVSEDTKKEIRRQIAKYTRLSSNEINLSTVTYHSGNVNFSVLGPMAQKASKTLKAESSVLYQSKEQLVWSAGSPSLVGDNAAVCAVKFTKEGKLAAAMKEAIVPDPEQTAFGSNSVAAVYRLEYLAMRPSVEFTVEGSLKKTIESFEIGVGAEIQLEALILEVGIQAKWEKIMSNTDLKITVKNFSGEEEEGLKWAKQLLLDYILDNFFEVSLSGGVSDWSKLTDSPEADAAVRNAKDTELAAEGEAEDEEEEDDDDKKDEDDPKEDGKKEEVEKAEAGKSETPEADAPKTDTPKTDTPKSETPKTDTPKADTPKSETAAHTVKALATAAKAAIPIPKVKVRAAYYKGEQENKINFEYSEMKAHSYPALPQALVLEGLVNPEAYVTEVNRSQNPFGLAYNVTVSLPEEAAWEGLGLKTINVKASYPAGAPKNKQSTHILTVKGGTAQGPNPFPFQYDARGSADVEYSVDYVFNPGGWEGATFNYSTTGKTDKGLITAMPESVVELLSLDIRLSDDFVWEDANQAVVTLSSKKWTGEKRVVLQRDKVEETTLKIRSDIKFKSEPVQCKVELRKNNKTIYSYGPELVEDNQVAVHDRFAGHVPVYFTAKFKDDSVEMNVMYKDGDFVWEDPFTLEKDKKREMRIIPTMKEIKPLSSLKAECEVDPSDGEPFTIKVTGGKNHDVKSSA